MKNNRVIISGGRGFKNYEMLKEHVSYYILTLPPDDVEIVSGCAEGADTLGTQYAGEYHYAIKFFCADWKGLGKAAGPIRNKQMAEYATHLIAFWDGKSKGTKNMIDEARAAGFKIRIVRY
jgi:hypothetical protein